MDVPFFDLREQLQEIGVEIEEAIDDVIESGRFIGGPMVEAFEHAMVQYTGARHAIGVSSGTDALLASLMALNVSDGDLVITTPYSFFATAGTVARLGATPVFVDIDPATYNMDPACLEAWFEQEAETRDRVKAIIPIHLFGQCAHMTPILEVAAAHGVPVVEDAAQAIGSRYPTSNGHVMAGTLGATGCLSFYPSKNLGGVGDGGMVLTDDDGLADGLRRLRNHGARPKYHHALVGGNFRLDPIQAAVLLVKLEYLEAWHARRREHAAYYDEHLVVAGIIKPTITYHRSCHIYNQYVISVPARRDELRGWLVEKGIGNEVYYPVPFHEQECFEFLGYSHGEFPRSEYAARHTLALPIYPELTTAQQDYVIEMLGDFYS